jgi:hypothetical protein
MLAARLRPVRVPDDGRPLDAGEPHAVISLMRRWQDKAGTRAVAAAERAAEERARRKQGVKTIPERVTAGEALMDEQDPGWWRADAGPAIDPDLLDLEDTGMCILGQRCPLDALIAYHEARTGAAQARLRADVRENAYYAWGYRLSGIPPEWAGARPGLFGWAVQHGFAGEPGEYRELTAVWARVIRARRSAA